MKSNKILSLFATVGCLFSMASCGSSQVQVGLGYDASFNGPDAHSNQNTAEVTSAFVAFKEDGTILDARIDVVQVAVEKGSGSNVVALKSSVLKNEAGYVKSKLEKGKDYNMKGSSALGVEVDGQIEAFADYCVGKTVAEVNALTADDISSFCSISFGSFQKAIASAYEHKSTTSYAASKKAKAGIAFASYVSEASHGKGYDQVTVDIGGCLVQKGVIVAAAIDAITFSFKVENDELAHNTSTKYYDASGKSLSKKTLGDAYAMYNAPYGSTLAEWDDQAAAFEATVAGVGVDAVTAITTDEFKAAGATISLTAYTYAVSQAAAYATLEHVGPQAE